MSKRIPKPSALGYNINNLNDYANLMGIDPVKHLLTVLTDKEVDTFQALKRAELSGTSYDMIVQETLLKSVRPEVYKANWYEWVKPVCRNAAPL